MFLLFYIGSGPGCQLGEERYTSFEGFAAAFDVVDGELGRGAEDGDEGGEGVEEVGVVFERHGSGGWVGWRTLLCIHEPDGNFYVDISQIVTSGGWVRFYVLSVYATSVRHVRQLFREEVREVHRIYGR